MTLRCLPLFLGFALISACGAVGPSDEQGTASNPVPADQAMSTDLASTESALDSRWILLSSPTCKLASALQLDAQKFCRDFKWKGVGSSSPVNWCSGAKYKGLRFTCRK